MIRHFAVIIGLHGKRTVHSLQKLIGQIPGAGHRLGIWIVACKLRVFFSGCLHGAAGLRRQIASHQTVSFPVHFNLSGRLVDLLYQAFTEGNQLLLRGLLKGKPGPPGKRRPLIVNPAV